MDIDNMTKDQFKELLYKAFRMELEGDVDINDACLRIYTEVQHLLALLRYPEIRPIQRTLEALGNAKHQP